MPPLEAERYLAERATALAQRGVKPAQTPILPRLVWTNAPPANNWRVRGSHQQGRVGYVCIGADFQVGLFRRQPDDNAPRLRPRRGACTACRWRIWAMPAVFPTVRSMLTSRAGALRSPMWRTFAFGGARAVGTGRCKPSSKINGVADDILPDADADNPRPGHLLCGKSPPILAKRPGAGGGRRTMATLFIGLNDYNNSSHPTPPGRRGRHGRWSSLSSISRTGKRCLVSTGVAGCLHAATGSFFPTLTWPTRRSRPSPTRVLARTMRGLPGATDRGQRGPTPWPPLRQGGVDGTKLLLIVQSDEEGRMSSAPLAARGAGKIGAICPPKKESRARCRIGIRPGCHTATPLISMKVCTVRVPTATRSAKARFSTSAMRSAPARCQHRPDR
jgi:hypothetical protein